MNSSKTLIGVVVIALIVGATAGFYFGMAKGKMQGFNDGKDAGLTQAADNAKKEAAAQINPFSDAAAPVNPFAEKTNPLENIKTNPFE